MLKYLKKSLIFVLIFFVLMIFIVFSINFYVKISTSNQIHELEELDSDEYECILVLGAGLRGGKPSPVLQDRLDMAIKAYNNKVASKIIMSGDHHQDNYDEVNVMKSYAIKNGVPSSDIFMDHAGLSTYDSIYRAKHIFGVKKLIVVTQEFHLYRSLYIANKLGLEASGLSATTRHYTNEFTFHSREILARNKDFVKVMFKPTSTYLGDSIPVSGNGDITNDKEFY